MKVKEMNHIIEVMSVLKKPTGLNNLKKISREQYMIKDTGEILDYNLSQTRADNTAGLKHTFKKIRDLINTNFTGQKNEIHLTLTYAENMTDEKKLYTDFKAFWRRYVLKHGQADYLSIVEPQGRGAWHCHVLIKHLEKQKVFIPSKELEKLWGQGFIKIKTLEGVDNIGAYLSAYLGDVEATDENIIEAFKQDIKAHVMVKEVEIEGIKKKFIKGGRLHLYPPGMNIYRKSKGIKHPEIVEMTYKKAKEKVGSQTPDFSRSISIFDENDLLVNTITYENYNTKRN